MEELLNHPDLFKVIIGLVLFLAVFIKVYVWLRDGGLYYRKHPIAASMDRVSRPGELSAKDVESAIMSVDTYKSKAEQVKDFESAIEAQK